MQQQLSIRREYVQKLNLSFPSAAYSESRKRFPRSPAPAPASSPTQDLQLMKGGMDQVMMADKSLISFVSNVGVANREDILESTLFAQLGAKHMVPDDNDFIGWYKKYNEILSKIGWTVEGGDVRHFSANGNVVELQSVIIDILTTAFGGSLVQIVTKALNAIKLLADTSGNIVAFEKNTHSESNGSFQVGVATEEAGAISINLGTFLITSSNKINHILFLKFTKDETDLQYASSKLTLDQNIYASVRDLVREKLTSRAHDFVAEIQV